MVLVDIILNEEQTEGTQAVLSQWLFAEGDWVEKNQPILEIETDKVMMEVIAPVSGKLHKMILHTGDDVIHSTPIGIIQQGSSEGLSKDNALENNVSANNEELLKQPAVDPLLNKLSIETNNNIVEPPNKDSSKLISPAVRRLLNQHNINVHNIVGTGKNHRITSRDIENHLSKNNSNSSDNSQHLPITNMRRSIAKHMVHSLLHTAPHVTSVFNLDLTAIIKHRKQHKQAFEQQKASLTFTSYFIAACVQAIKHQPMINSQLHEKTIEVFSQMNIGIGTALNDGGLIVPVLKNCQDRDLFSIAKELTLLTNKARSTELKPRDVQGGTFTISNHGVSGSLIATPIIINQPQSAILGIGKMEKRVIVREIDGDDVMVIKPMCYVSLTIDHRVLDAQQCNQFLSVFVETLENLSL